MEFFNSHISKKAIEFANQVLQTGWISQGNMVEQFEFVLSNQYGLINPVSLNSGTSALHLACVMSGIKEGDEVILSPQTFVATAMVILMQKAVPVFADIQINTGNIDPVSILEKITGKTKAIMAVHWGGYPCDLDEIHKIAKDNNLIVIEDAAHAFGATYKGNPIGSISPYTAFSFQAIKHVTSGDGGALCCINASDYLKAKRLRWFGIDRDNSMQSILGERKYNISDVGYKYHMNDLAAAIGLGNLEDFDKRIERRRQIANIYGEELKKVSGLKLLKYNGDREHSYWFYTLQVDNRDKFLLHMNANDIPVSVVHSRIDQYEIFLRYFRNNLPNQTIFNNIQVSLPLHEKLTNEDIYKIIKIIRSGW